MGEGNFVLCADLVAHHYLIYVIELIPILIVLMLIPVEGFKLGAAWYSHIQSFSSVETLLIKQVEVIFVHEVT